MPKKWSLYPKTRLEGSYSPKLAYKTLIFPKTRSEDSYPPENSFRRPLFFLEIA